MEIESFARITYRVLRSTPFEEYQPTLCLPQRKSVYTLAGVPVEHESRIRSIALEWAEREAEAGEEYLLAFREESDSFRVIRRFAGCYEDALFRVDEESSLPK